MDLGADDLRAVSAFAAICAEEVLGLFEADRPDDPRPAAAVATAWEFARGGRRGKALRDAAWAAMRAAQESASEAADAAARSAMAAAGAAYLHPLPNATQVKHVLGAAAFAARALELAAGDDPAVGAAHLAEVSGRVGPEVVEVLLRYPPAPAGGGRVGELTRLLDTALRP
ncbi:putative immunity protein [Pseudonocardia broussonetiae]|uniref:putative immunity protein n=1 Tax=Pseudonocardia broussonetiae TaxID=2736640 RepID=UPI0030842BE7